MAETSISGIEFVIQGSTNRAKTSVDKLRSSLEGLKTSLRTSSVGKFKNDMDSMDRSAKKTSTTLGKLMRSVGRVGFYRMIRAAIKFITDGFKEGLDNAYQFSKVTGYELAGTMDRLASSSLKMKNQLGSAFGGLIMAIEPILLQIIALVTRAANALAQFMAIIGGKSTYLKAVDTVKEYGEAVGGAGEAAKEAMKYLAPFDELNRLPGDNGSSSGGGGGSTPDYSAMFEETPVSQAIQDFASDFKITVSDVLFDWTNLTPEQIAEKVLAGLFALTGAGVGFILGGVPGALVGSIIGLTLGLVADTFIFNHDGVLSKSEIAHSLQYVLNGLAGGIIGFSIGGPGGALIGVAVGLGASLLLEAAQFLNGSTPIDTSVLLDQLTVALGAFTGAVIGWSVGGPVGAAIGAVVGIGVTGIITAIKFNKSDGVQSESGRTGLDYFVVDVLGMPTNAEWQQYGENVWKEISGGLSSGWHWLTDGFKDIGTEIYNILFKPIVDAFNDFVSSHPKIAELLGLKQTEGTGIGGTPVGVELEVTGVSDNIPPEKKTLKDFIAGLFGSKDEIPPEEKKISLTGNFTKRTVGEKVNAPVSMKANLTSRSVGKKVNAAVSMKANFTSRSVGKKVNAAINVKANFTSRSVANGVTSPISTRAYISSVDTSNVDRNPPTIPVNGKIYSVNGQPISGINGYYGGVYKGGHWNPIQSFAGGGNPFGGQIFRARENGNPELVGTLRGSTAVMNNDQIVASVSQGVARAIAGISFHISGGGASSNYGTNEDTEEMMYRAMLRALNDSDIDERPIELDGDVIYRKMVQYNQRERRRLGVNPMLSM